MSPEQLDAMPNHELDLLAAVKILWNGFVNVPVDDWKPTTDLNCAMKLLECGKFRLWDILKRGTDTYTVVMVSMPYPLKDTVVHDKSLPRAITIACLLVSYKEE